MATPGMMMRRTKQVARRSSKYLEVALYRRLFREGSAEARMRKELNEFLKSRKRVFKWEVGVSLRSRHRYYPALKFSEVLSKRGMNLTPSDHAIRLDLVAKARGITSAKEYFINLPEQAKKNVKINLKIMSETCIDKNMNDKIKYALIDKYLKGCIPDVAIFFLEDAPNEVHQQLLCRENDVLQEEDGFFRDAAFQLFTAMNNGKIERPIFLGVRMVE